MRTRGEEIHFAPCSGGHLSKEATCHILEQGMKKERPLIAGWVPKRAFFNIMFNKLKAKKRKLEPKIKHTGNKCAKL